MAKREMKKGNWIMLFTGIGLLFLGLIVVALVGASYHGVLALIASALLILGVVTIFWGLSADFE
ncbi:MAG: hypothetical protein ACP5PT_05820 [Brevinematia bacterium]|jgi:uncharacterized membrane protein HdeD (DUF308 family)